MCYINLTNIIYSNEWTATVYIIKAGGSINVGIV